MKGKFYVIGVGPGDPELMTLKAVRLLEKCQVWLTPTGRKNGESTALAIVENVVSNAGKEILTHYFPMKKVHMGQEPDPEVKEAWDQAASKPVSHADLFFVPYGIGSICKSPGIENLKGFFKLWCGSP